jgi:peptidoglycan/LPS O-acetylase OafA/YrhL
VRLDIQGIEKWSLLAVTRFALAFIVAIGHLEQQVPLGPLAVVPMFGPFEAVLGFLLISGYSIGNSYAREREGFLRRRALRIYPVYLGAILLTWLATPHAFDITFATTLLQNVLFLNQITTATSYVGPAWSLALEVWLYCLTP